MLSFGLPTIVRKSDGSFLLAFWCEEEGIPVPPNVDIETVPETEEKAGLLGCVTAPTVPWALTGLLGLLAIRRR